MQSNLVKISSQKTFETLKISQFHFPNSTFWKVWATSTIHKTCRKSSAGCLPMIAHVDMVPKYFHFSFFPWCRILHAMTQIRYWSDHMWVGLSCTAGYPGWLFYSESHRYSRHESRGPCVRCRCCNVAGVIDYFLGKGLTRLTVTQWHSHQ